MLETLEYTIRIGSTPTFYISIRNDKRTEHWTQEGMCGGAMNWHEQSDLIELG